LGLADRLWRHWLGLLREHGFRVTGSDSGVYPPASNLLESLGISFFSELDATHLRPAPDLVIVGNIIRAWKIQSSRKFWTARFRYRSMPEILEEVFLSERHSIVVSGTHEKHHDGNAGMDFQTAGKRPNFW